MLGGRGRCCKSYRGAWLAASSFCGRSERNSEVTDAGVIRRESQNTRLIKYNAYFDCAATCETKRKLDSNKSHDMFADSVQVDLLVIDVFASGLLCGVCFSRGVSSGLEDATIISAAKNTITMESCLNQRKDDEIPAT